MAYAVKEILSSRFAQWLLYKFIRIYSLSYRLEVENEKVWLDDYDKKKSSILLCVHHQQFFAAIRYFQRYKDFKPGLMISQSKDGDFIAGVANLSGWTTVRGSSSKGGREALKAMIDHLAEHRLAAHIIDGPRGPHGIVKPGAIRLAEATGSTIVPFYTGADRSWHARSWDKFLIPKPFSKVILRFGEKMLFNESVSSEDFETQRKALEERMFQENEQLKADLQ